MNTPASDTASLPALPPLPPDLRPLSDPEEDGRAMHLRRRGALGGALVLSLVKVALFRAACLRLFVLRDPRLFGWCCVGLWVFWLYQGIDRALFSLVSISIHERFYKIESWVGSHSRVHATRDGLRLRSLGPRPPETAGTPSN
jgi:hypothetical protein